MRYQCSRRRRGGVRLEWECSGGGRVKALRGGLRADLRLVSGALRRLLGGGGPCATAAGLNDALARDAVATATEAPLAGSAGAVVVARRPAHPLVVAATRGGGTTNAVVGPVERARAGRVSSSKRARHPANVNASVRPRSPAQPRRQSAVGLTSASRGGPHARGARGVAGHPPTSPPRASRIDPCGIISGAPIRRPGAWAATTRWIGGWGEERATRAFAARVGRTPAAFISFRPSPPAPPDPPDPPGRLLGGCSWWARAATTATGSISRNLLAFLWLLHRVVAGRWRLPVCPPDVSLHRPRRPWSGWSLCNWPPDSAATTHIEASVAFALSSFFYFFLPSSLQVRSPWTQPPFLPRHPHSSSRCC